MIDSSSGEVLEAVHDLAQQMDDRFMKVEQEVSGIKAVMVTKDELQSEMSKLKNTLVTKDYLDDKLADQHVKIVQYTAKQIEKALG